MKLYDYILVLSVVVVFVIFIIVLVKHFVMLYKLKSVYKNMKDNECKMERKLRDSGYFTKFIFRWTSKGAERYF
jgi:hypothetical protein